MGSSEINFPLALTYDLHMLEDGLLSAEIQDITFLPIQRLVIMTLAGKSSQNHK